MGTTAATACAEVIQCVLNYVPDPQTFRHPLVVGLTLGTLLIALIIRSVPPPEDNAITFNELAADIGAATIILGGELMAVAMLFGGQSALPSNLVWVWSIVPTITGGTVMNFARIELRELRQRAEHVYTVTDRGSAFALMLLSIYFLCQASVLAAHFIPQIAHGH